MRTLLWVLVALALLSGPARFDGLTVPLYKFCTVSSYTNTPISISAIVQNN